MQITKRDCREDALFSVYLNSEATYLGPWAQWVARLETDELQQFDIDIFRSWLKNNISGKWLLDEMWFNTVGPVWLYLENDTDVVLLKLRWM